jgi:hypothetical protein
LVGPNHQGSDVSSQREEIRRDEVELRFSAGWWNASRKPTARLAKTTEEQECTGLR